MREERSYRLNGEKIKCHSMDTDKFFYKISYILAFDDCSGDEVSDIIWDGKPVEYVGWQPGMRYEFEEVLTGKTVWVGDFPEWDH
jgi:hypothetical protein